MGFGRPVPMGQGSVTFICTKCGKQERISSFTTGGGLPSNVKAPQIPGPTQGGKCPDTSSGNHVWEQQ